MNEEGLCDGMVPLSRAALELRQTRERTLRRIQTGELQGDLVNGRWYVYAAALESAKAARASSAGAAR